MRQFRPVRCAIWRGGTSKGVYFLDNDLPADPGLRDRVLLEVFGSPDRRQINGLGGADPLTSKLAIVGPPTRPDADVDYTFGQVAMEEAKIFYHSMCGNITSGVGPFAIQAGLVRAEEGVTRVRMHNRNTGRLVVAEVPVSGGSVCSLGDYAIAGVPGTGARINVDFAGTAGALTGSLLPTGNVQDRLDVPGVGAVTVSIVDCSTCQVYLRAEELGLQGTEGSKEIDSDPELLRKLERVRAFAAYRVGLARTPNAASSERRNTPHLVLVSPPRAYRSHLTGEPVSAADVDVNVRMLFMQILHKTFAGTGLVCTSVASKIPGTLVFEAAREESRSAGGIRIGHPAGVIATEVSVSQTGGGFRVDRVAIGRTARPIMDGCVYVREELFRQIRL